MLRIAYCVLPFADLPICRFADLPFAICSHRRVSTATALRFGSVISNQSRPTRMISGSSSAPSMAIGRYASVSSFGMVPAARPPTSALRTRPGP